MELKDIFLAPLYLILIYAIAYSKRGKVSNKITKKYFIPALTAKIIGGIALGLVYQFYYGDGTSVRADTGKYYSQSKIVTEAFYDNPAIGLKLLASGGEYDQDTYNYSSRIYWYESDTEFFVIKVAAIFGLIGFNSYSVIAIFFAFISFTGMWAMYLTFLKFYPQLHKEFAIAIFFLPSVFFWGSGVMKDTLTIGSIGWVFYAFQKAFIEKRGVITSILIMLFATWVAFSVKKYIVLSFLPPAMFWIFMENNNKIKNKGLRMALKPIFAALGILIAYIGGTTLTAGDEKYDLENIAETTKINSEYLSEYVASGSAYNIGQFDGTLGSMIQVAPQAINIAIFRPYIWEVSNPFMLLSALEASFLLYLTILIILKVGVIKSFSMASSMPIVTFCLIFSLIFAFGVGTNSGNFGTLVRYKIPLMPFFLCALYIMQYHVKSSKKLRRFAVTE